MRQAITSQQQPFIDPPARAKTYSHHTRQSNKAKRLVETKQMSREQWLQIRKQGIGSSDAATACGLNPHMSMLELWMIKTGLMQQGIEDESTGYAPLYWGKRLEPLVAEYYSMHTNHKVRRINAVLQHPDEDKAFMFANLDYTVVGSDEVQILECKTVGEYGAKLWRGGVPLYILCQVQHQLAVTGKQAGFYQEELDEVARQGYANAKFEMEGEEGLEVVDEFYHSDEQQHAQTEVLSSNVTTLQKDLVRSVKAVH